MRKVRAINRDHVSPRTGSGPVKGRIGDIDLVFRKGSRGLNGGHTDYGNRFDAVLEPLGDFEAFAVNRDVVVVAHYSHCSP